MRLGSAGAWWRVALSLCAGALVLTAGAFALADEATPRPCVIGCIDQTVTDEIRAYLDSPEHDGKAELARKIGDYLKNPGFSRAPTKSLIQLAAAATPPNAAPQSAAAPAPATPAGEKTYVGREICVACHRQESQNVAHTIHAGVFYLNPRDALEAHGCETCHGPGSAHVQNPTEPLGIIRFSHRSQTPIAQQNEVCLQCHRGGQRIFWAASVHESHDLACSDCHNPMANFTRTGLTARGSINETCMSCHRTQRAEFSRRSHMPLLEGQLTCVDCHNPHGSTTEPLLKADSVNESCLTCHAEKRGPFLFEHAPVRDNCLSCHTPHGSNHENLLVTARPLLCQQCHAQSLHPAELMTMGHLANGPLPDPRAIGRSCNTCHTQIHGSNSPAGSRFER
jgi:DmsE family decaheme c-type cytochrome